ncbi:hypothetical protein DPMN_159984 [Dreissena polymorpha]|uniref:Uncharacterized protein n=1 Tax=Dreissena polymorpha TaxID=45954 RepID=A0A9D4IS60_DREPO|nr:hypothetical protein DPMN_159984 [Dreissena polymorpha]
MPILQEEWSDGTWSKATNRRTFQSCKRGGDPVPVAPWRLVGLEEVPLALTSPPVLDYLAPASRSLPGVWLRPYVSLCPVTLTTWLRPSVRSLGTDHRVPVI